MADLACQNCLSSSISDNTLNSLNKKPNSKKTILTRYSKYEIEQLSEARIIKKDLVYIIGLSPNIAKPEVKFFKILFRIGFIKARIYGTIWKNIKNCCKYIKALYAEKKYRRLLFRLYNIFLL